MNDADLGRACIQINQFRVLGPAACGPALYYSSGLLHGRPPFFRLGLCDAGGLELGVVVVPSGAGLVASSPS